MERGQKLKDIVTGIIDVADSMSPNQQGTVEHIDVLRVTACIVKEVLSVLAADNRDPEMGIRAYGDELMVILDPILDGH